MDKKPAKELTELQKAFLSHLFGDCHGDPVAARKAAGYSDATSTKAILEGMEDEITSLSLSYAAMHGPKMIMTLVKFLDDGNTKGGSNTLKAISILREIIGLGGPKTDTVDLKVPSGGLFILPAKEVQNYKKIEEEEEDAEELQ